MSIPITDDRPKLYVGPLRRDGKRRCTFAYTNGVRLVKLLTALALEEIRQRGQYAVLDAQRR